MRVQLLSSKTQLAHEDQTRLSRWQQQQLSYVMMGLGTRLATTIFLKRTKNKTLLCTSNELYYTQKNE